MFTSPVITVPAYYLSLFLFGAGGLLMSLFSLLSGFLPSSSGVERFFRRLLHHIFRAFLAWGRWAGVVDVRFRDFPNRVRGGLVVVANHPSLVDAVCLFARNPEAVCLFKPAIRRNPVLGATARRAGYLAAEGGFALVRSAAAKVAEGNTLIVFPEGTRTPPHEPLLPFKPGFVLIARRAGVAIQLVRITAVTPFLGKAVAWWKPPALPARIDVEGGPLIDPDNALRPAELTAQIEAWFRDAAPVAWQPAVIEVSLNPSR